MKKMFRRTRICSKCLGRSKTEILVLRIIGSGENYSVCSGGFTCGGSEIRSLKREETNLYRQIEQLEAEIELRGKD